MSENFNKKVAKNNMKEMYRFCRMRDIAAEVYAIQSMIGDKKFAQKIRILYYVLFSK